MRRLFSPSMVPWMRSLQSMSSRPTAAARPTTSIARYIGFRNGLRRCSAEITFIATEVRTA
ncbi:Uncharacterised protein [uncultured archaeon]|nr:Uncharacterised protein [uncultured archaeon]